MIRSSANEKAGEILRHWRKARRLSQMDLAASANVSARHLSFVETGRAKPSQDLVLRLSEALHLPLRHANALLVAAGYAPRYTHWSLDDDQTGVVRFALERILSQHDPYPAIVTNRNYDIVMTNGGFRGLIEWLTGGEEILARYPNIYRLVFAKDGLRPYFVGREAIYTILLKRLYEESLAYQSEALTRLYNECASDHHLVAETTEFEQQLPVLTFALQKDTHELRFFSTMTTFGSAIDVTVQELKIESMFPADEATQAFFQQQLP